MSPGTDPNITYTDYSYCLIKLRIINDLQIVSCVGAAIPTYVFSRQQIVQAYTTSARGSVLYVFHFENVDVHCADLHVLLTKIHFRLSTMKRVGKARKVFPYVDCIYYTYCVS